jgi:SAM-dependent methyltransferase
MASPTNREDRVQTIEGLKRALDYGGEIQALLARDLASLVAQEGSLRILDVGCGTTSMLAAFNARPSRTRCRLIGLDIHAPTIAWCRAHGFHDDYICADATDESALPEVDVIVATDLIEHLEKPAALSVLALFERKASIAVEVLTPNGYIFNPFNSDNPFMEHRCGFEAADLRSLGYECSGLGGPKRLRGSHAIPFRPRIASVPLLAVLSRVMRSLPAQSFHLLGRKRLSTERTSSHS